MIRDRLAALWESRRARWITGVAIGLIALYGALGFWVAPGIVRDQLITRLSAALDRPVTLTEVRLNPYALSATFTGFAVTERDGRTIVAFDELYANLSVTSLLHWAWVLSEIHLARPQVHLVLGQDGALNLAALGSADTGPAPAEPATLPRLLVGDLVVADGQISFEDQRFPQIPARRAERISFGLKDFSTLPDESGTHTFAAVTDAGTTVSWRGTIGVNPIQSTGQIAVSGLRVTQLGPYLAPAATELLGGTLDLRADYSLRVAADSSEFTVKNGRLALNDVRARHAKLDLTPLNLALDPVNLGWQRKGTEPPKVSLDLVPNGSGSIAVQGTLATDPIAADLSVTLGDVELVPYQTFIDPYARAALERGKLDSIGTVSVRAGDSPEIRFEGGAVVRDFAAVDTRTQQRFARWQRLAIEKIRYTDRPERLEIAAITADQPYLRFLIGPDRVTNVQHILDVDGAEAAAAGAKPAASTPALATRIGRIAIRGGSANFADHSLTPHFATGIQQLNGTVQGLSSDPKARAKVSLRGKVDRYAPTVIEGEINPLAADAFTDLSFKFENIELTTFTPYSGKFAGFRIDKGKLDLDLHYKLQERQLNGDNRIVLNQLTLGERVESPDALELPIRLAVAILKDSRGIIDLELPVSGNVDDPEFSYGGLIARAIVSLIMKAVTAPFSLLASAIGGGEELGFIAFTAGGAELQSAGRDKLDKLAQALTDRPGLQLEVRGAASPEADRRALAAARLNHQIRGDKSVPVDAPLSGSDRRRLFALYEKTFRQDPPAGDERLPEQERELHRIQAARLRLVDALPVSEDELRELARGRAAAIVEHLVTRAPDLRARIFTVDVVTTATVEADGVHAELKLGAL